MTLTPQRMKKVSMQAFPFYGYFSISSIPSSSIIAWCSSLQQPVPCGIMTLMATTSLQALKGLSDITSDHLLLEPY